MRISLLAQKDQERADLEEAMRRFQEAGGAVAEAPIIAGREAYFLAGFHRGYGHAGDRGSGEICRDARAAWLHAELVCVPRKVPLIHPVNAVSATPGMSPRTAPGPRLPTTVRGLRLPD